MREHARVYKHKANLTGGGSQTNSNRGCGLITVHLIQRTTVNITVRNYSWRENSMFAYDSLALGRTRPISDWAVAAKNPKNAQFNRGCLTFCEVTTHPSALFEAPRAQEGRAGQSGSRSSPSSLACVSPGAGGCLLICEISG